MNSFSQAVDQELRDKNVTCSVLAPGFVETGFAKAGNLEGTAMVKAGGAKAADVVKIGYDGMMAGKLVIINERMLGFTLNWIMPLLPRRMVLKILQKTQSK